MHLPSTIRIDLDQTLALAAAQLKIDRSALEFDDEADDFALVISTTTADVKKLTGRIERAVARTEVESSEPEPQPEPVKLKPASSLN